MKTSIRRGLAGNTWLAMHVQEWFCFARCTRLVTYGSIVLRNQLQFGFVCRVFIRIIKIQDQVCVNINISGEARPRANKNNKTIYTNKRASHVWHVFIVRTTEISGKKNWRSQHKFKSERKTDETGLYWRVTHF